MSKKLTIVLILIWIPLASYTIGRHNDAIAQTKVELAQMRQQIEASQQYRAEVRQWMDETDERIEYLTHPATIHKRSIEYVMGTGEFAK